jgi:hypothetical protein
MKLQARLSEKYVLRIDLETDGSCTIWVLGPRPIQDRHQYVAGSGEAQREAYSLGRKHFIYKGIAEIPVESDDLEWVALVE